ncbi:MAG: PAS domain S-box protein [Thermoanaerobaculaceae bacterium]
MTRTTGRDSPDRKRSAVEPKPDGLRRSGIDPVGDVPWGTHFCQFYQTSEDLVETLVPYLRAGLESNELCMWITSAPLGAPDATAALRGALPGLDAYLASGQIEILDYSQWYTRTGRFEADSVLRGWVDKLADARRRGFDGLRLTGNTLWLEQDAWDDFTRYEEAINEVIGRYRMLALCTYSLTRCGVGEIMDVVANHQFALIKRHGRWEIIEQSAHGKTERALRESEARYRTLFEGMTEGFALHEAVVDEHGTPCDYRFLEVNPAFERLTGLSRETILGKTAREVLPGLEPVWIETFGRVASTGQPAQLQEHSATLGRDFEVRAFSPRPGQFAVLFTDTTENKRAKAREVWLASFPEQNPNPVAEVNLTTRVVSYCNPAARACFPDLTARGLDHPWLAGIESIAETLAATGSTSTLREVWAGDSWWRQSLSRPHPGRYLRIYCTDVTDRVAAQHAAEAARAEAVTERNRLEAVMEALPVGVAIVDTLGGTTHSNRMFEEIWRGPRPSPRSVEDYESYRAWWTDTGQPVRPEEWASARAVRQGETVVGQVMEIERFDGTRAFIHNSAAPYLDADGVIAGSAVALVDVTELRGKEVELERLNERLVQAQRSAGAGMWEWDLATQRLTWSPELFRLFGLDPATVTATFETWREVLHPDDRQAAEDRIDQALRDQVPLQSEYRIVLPTGEVRWINALGNATYDQSGAPQRMAGFCIDITRRKQVEDELRRQREWLRVTLTSIGDAVVACDLEGRVTFVNPVAESLTGWKAEEVLGLPVGEVLRVVNEQTGQPAEGLAARVLREGRVFGHANHSALVSRDGRSIPIEDSAAPIMESAGVVSGAVLVFRDVTEKRRAQEAVRTSEERLRLALEASAMGTFEVDLVTGAERWNPTEYSLLGLQPGGTPAGPELFFSFVHPDDIEDLQARWREALRIGILDTEFRIVRADGQERWLAGKGHFTFEGGASGAGGRAVRFMGVNFDITERKQAEAGIRAALKEKEVLLKEIHHRVKNNLQIIASMLNLQLSFVADDAARGPLIDSQNRVKTLALIHEKLYGSSDLARIPLDAYVSELASFVHDSFGSRARSVTLDVEVEAIELEIGVAIPVALILNELIANALKHAFPSGGEGRVVVGLHRVEARSYELSVKDDGIGFPAGLDPHNSATLGLQLVSDLAAQVGGDLAVHRDGGTCFVLSFREPT